MAKNKLTVTQTLCWVAGLGLIYVTALGLRLRLKREQIALAALKAGDNNLSSLIKENLISDKGLAILIQTHYVASIEDGVLILKRKLPTI